MIPVRLKPALQALGCRFGGCREVASDTERLVRARMLSKSTPDRIFKMLQQLFSTIGMSVATGLHRDWLTTSKPVNFGE